MCGVHCVFQYRHTSQDQDWLSAAALSKTWRALVAAEAMTAGAMTNTLQLTGAGAVTSPSTTAGSGGLDGVTGTAFRATATISVL